ncbi:MAG: hypothetical protein ACRDSF_16400 [Pseudonocardiaceae bacterium]
MTVALVLDARWKITRSRWIIGLAAAWNVLVFVSPIWWVPHAVDREYGQYVHNVSAGA